MGPGDWTQAWWQVPWPTERSLWPKASNTWFSCFSLPSAGIAAWLGIPTGENCPLLKIDLECNYKYFFFFFFSFFFLVRRCCWGSNPGPLTYQANPQPLSQTSSPMNVFLRKRQREMAHTEEGVFKPHETGLGLLSLLPLGLWRNLLVLFQATTLKVSRCCSHKNQYYGWFESGLVKGSFSLPPCLPATLQSWSCWQG